MLSRGSVFQIQYTSPSEHQWKFPLVRELTQAITANKQLLGASLDVDYQVSLLCCQCV